MTPLPAPSLLDRLRAHAHLHPESAELLRDAAGCHAVTSDEGTSYCPLAEANAAAAIRDAERLRADIPATMLRDGKG